MRIALLLVLLALPGLAQSTRDPDRQKTGLESVQRSPTGAAMAELGAFACPEAQATPAPAPPTRTQFLTLLDQLRREFGAKADGRVCITTMIFQGLRISRSSSGLIDLFLQCIACPFRASNRY